MSTPIAPPEQAPPSQSELLIDRRLRETRRQLAGVEVADGLITLAAGTLVYLLVAALVDHWLVPGGVGFFGRFVLFLILVAGAGAFFARKVLPLLVRRIHPLFAASVIEETRPEMKNSLVNFLFLRRQPDAIGRDAIAHRFYEGLERKTAAELSELNVETTVDRAGAIRHGYVLAGVLAVLCLYLLISPKSPLVSIRRVIWPWADVPPPTRVSITEIEPGDAEAFQGDSLAVSAKVSGLRDDDSVLAYYTTADGQSVDQAVPMTVDDDGYRHRCELPPAGSGLQQDLTYYLAAGDFRSRKFFVKVQTAPAIPVEEIRYDYPDYTGLADRTVRDTGDVRAIEGTRVTVRAAANQPIRQAVMEMDCDPRRGISMTAQSTAASGRFTLKMKEDRQQPLYQSYQIRFTDTAGHENRRPIRHRIDVIRDEPPEIHFVDPPPEQIELPVDGVLELKVRAEDPDFALRRVVLKAERDGRSLPIRPLLEKPRPEKAQEGPFEGSYRFEPARLELKAGDEVEYWAEASDNREDPTGPAPNRAETARRTILIVSSDGQNPADAGVENPQQQPDSKQPGQQDQPGDQPGEAKSDQGGAGDQPQDMPADDQQPGEPGGRDQPQQDGQHGDQEQNQDQGQKPEDGQPSSDDPQSAHGEQPQDGQQPNPDQQGQGERDPSGQQPEEGQPSDQGTGDEGQQGQDGQQGQNAQPASEPVDGQTNPGDAFEKVLQYKAEQEQNQQPSGGSPQPDQTPTGQEPGDSPPQGPQQDQVGKPSPGQSSDGQSKSQPGDAEGGKPSEDRQSPAQQSDTPGTQGERTDERAQGDEDVGKGTGEQPKLEGQPSTPQAVPDNPQGGMKAEPGQEKPGDGQGAQSQGAGEPLEQKPPDASQSPPDATGGDPSQPKGEAGAGKPSTDPTGSPSPQEANQPRDKTSTGPEQDPSAAGEAKSPTTSPKQSDSQGETAGDRSGGGEQGGGQKSDQEGTGSAGTHTASDQGGSRSEQQGQGETGSNAGDQAKSDGSTGQSDKQQQGSGSGSRTAPGGQQPGGQPKPEQTASPGGPSNPADQPGSGDPGSLDPNAKGPQSSGNPVSGGTPGQPSGQSSGQTQGPLGGEDVNLDYARRQTELALEYLEDQLAKNEPDRDLLDRLGWTRDDMEAFVRRWQQMRREAGRGGSEGTEAKQDLDEALKSLGITPRSTEINSGRSAPDDVRRLKDSGRHEPPAKWKDLFEAYTRSISSPTE